MDLRQNYLATKMIKDKFIALDNQNNLFCWNIVTGKLLSVNRIYSGVKYSEFEVFNSYGLAPVD
jgi:hypothetical protein